MADDLQELDGVGRKTEEKLNEAGYKSFRNLATANPSTLSEEADVGENTAKKVVRNARDKADVGKFESAAERLESREDELYIPTLVPEVDDIMGGGIETQAITELYGEFGAGKSQIVHQLMVNAQLTEEDGGLHGSALLVDSEDTFRTDRIRDMVRGLPEDVREREMEERGISQDEGTEALVRDFLDKIYVVEAFDSSHQMLAAEDAADKIQQLQDTDYPARLIAVDSVTAHFRAEYVGRGELADRQQKLNEHLHTIDKAAKDYNVAAVITNQVSADPDSYFGDPTSPIGGNVIGHTSTFRVYLKKSSGSSRIWSIEDAPNLNDLEAKFEITPDGIKPA